MRPFTVIHMPRDYSFVNPYFFSQKADILRLINEDLTGEKWLVYIPFISEGIAFCKELKQSYCMLNGEEREKNPKKWYEILEREYFTEKVAVVTSTVDAGVNFKDDFLTNVVIFSTSPITFTQVLGRKRRKQGDHLNLYAWCPSPEKINSILQRNLTLQETLNSFWTNKCSFIRQSILDPVNVDFRSIMYLHKNGDIEPNHLTSVQLNKEAQQLQQFLDYAKEHKDPSFFDHFVARWLRLTLPKRSECWIDEQFSGAAKRQFMDYLQATCGQEMNETAFLAFVQEFQTKCIAAFGKAAGGKDRDDRAWKLTKLNNKLTELHIPFRVECNSIRKIYCLVCTQTVQP